MNGQKVTFEEVRNAYNTLVGAGEKPTVKRIRRVIGHGSHTTVARYLRKIRAALETRRVATGHLVSVTARSAGFLSLEIVVSGEELQSALEAIGKEVMISTRGEEVEDGRA